MAIKPSTVGVFMVLLALAAGLVMSVRFTIAHETVSGVNSKLYEANKVLSASGVNLADSSWRGLEAQAERAVRIAPHNGYYWNALARVYYVPRTVGGTAISPNYLAAYQAARKAVVALPSSGYAWLSLAYASDHLFAQNQLPGGKAAMEQAITRTLILGSHEPQLLGGVIDLGLANWPNLGAAAKQDVLRAVAHLSQQNKGDVMAIADRRGALPMVCAEKILASHRVCMDLSNTLPLKKAAA
jgi:hypothetical protein